VTIDEWMNADIYECKSVSVRIAMDMFVPRLRNCSLNSFYAVMHEL
jgi:hypothetical protein